MKDCKHPLEPFPTFSTDAGQGEKPKLPDARRGDPPALRRPDPRSERERRAMRFLSQFLICDKMKRLRRLERARFAALEQSSTDLPLSELLDADASVWDARMLEVASLLRSLPPSRERTLLYYRYICNDRFSATADSLGVSLRTAFRIHRRALAMVADVLDAR